jgi:hypothetical protein
MLSPAALNHHADRIFVAQWAREIIKVVYNVGFMLSMIFWVPPFFSYLWPGDSSKWTSAIVAALAGWSCLLATWKIHMDIRSATKTLDKLDSQNDLGD